MFKYQKLADILKKLIHTKSQIKDLIYNQPQSTKSSFNPAVAYSNLSLILNNYPQFQTMYAKIQKKSNAITNKYLFYVLVAEYLNVGSIKGGGKLKKLVLENLAFLPQVETKSKINKSSVQIRLRNIQDNQQRRKWKQLLQKYQRVPIVKGMYHLSYQEYSSLVANNPDLRNTQACVVQSWSSALPPVFLFSGLLGNQNIHRKFDIIDACSAPGNKTLQLAQFLSERGTVFAFEKNERRFQILKRNIQKHNALNISAKLQSFMDVNPNDAEYKRVKLILLDPSCSGSGMLTNYSRDNPQEAEMQLQMGFKQFVKMKYDRLEEKEKERVLLLQKFQLELLTHAATFNPQRISYSTCSIYQQQNEQVVERFLKIHPQFHLISVRKGDSQKLSSGFGKQFQYCVRVDPRTRQSDGFFVCVFNRNKKI